MCTREEMKQAIREALEENNKSRDEKWDARMTQFVIEVMEKTNISINKRIEHLKPSPTTRKELDELKKCQKNISEKVNSLHSIFTSSKFTIKVFVWLFSSIGVIAGSLIAVRELFRK